MNYLKNFENYTSDDVNVGDFVLVKEDAYLPHFKGSYGYESIIDFLSLNIGEVITTYIIDRLRIRYFGIPQELKKFFQYDKSNGYHIHIDLNNISHISSNKEDLKIIITSKKYNL